jgi:signal transduction histidine kinase
MNRTTVLDPGRDRETVLPRLLDRLFAQLPFDRAQVMFVEDRSRLSVRALFDGERVVLLPAGERPEIDAAGHPVLREVLSGGAAVAVPDVREHAGWGLPEELAAEASWMGVPLFVRGEVAALLTLSRREPAAFDGEHVRLAETIVSQESLAIENAILHEQVEASKVRLRTLSLRLVEAQERERRRVARELHDEAGQALASLRFGLRVLEREAAEGGAVAPHVADLVRTTDAVIDGLHRLAADLRPATLDHLGLEAALRQYCRSAGSQFGLTVRFKAVGLTGERLPTALETALYRVVQEAMTNVVRHAAATQVDVLAQRRGDRVMVMVEDDGVGFVPQPDEPGEHCGLLGLQERAEALGGTLTIETAPGAGTTVVVEVPRGEAHPDR